MNATTNLKFLLIGIDGASFDVVHRLIDRGQLPNFARLRERAASSVLQSTFPPHTAPGWASMLTGVEPGEHGIYQFWSLQESDYAPRGMNVGDYGREPIWVALERHGLRVGVHNVPMTHPPRALRDGYMISWPLSTTLRYTAPPSLMRELLDAGLHYHSDIVTMYRGQRDYDEQAHKFTADRAATCRYLQEVHPVDAMFVVFTEVDRVSHHYWGEQDHPGPAVERCYEDMDRALGSLLEMTDEQTLVIVASDHGFGRCQADFQIHELLEQHGLMATRYEPVDTPASGDGQDDASLHAWFESQRRYKRTVDWSRTRFYMPSPGCFGLNANLKGRQQHGVLEPGELADAEAALRDALATVVDDQGRPWFTLERRAEVYRGRCLETGPDYLVVPRDFSVMVTPNLTGQLWSAPVQSGVHRPDGILFLAGPSVSPGAPLFARIEDIYPTILVHLGLPVPDDLDGHWLLPPRQPVEREAVQQPDSGRRLSVDESAFMDLQLRAIGYL
ncbi:alkaline phosphatase family protein [Roseateles amylovorans]|uniref:Alkaline phosphatase family protein n=1 Tax=Roseateles amylovorans TaxID=2978473 RepID=A0ABY6ATV5_9BURK|nr:alkaline phosphatase family protein [Roseateles amylovorans]UXH76097.1 alkaline phosphatase family protein [Roseateles amylovorans]